MSGHLRTTYWRWSAPLALSVALALVSGCDDPVAVAPPTAPPVAPPTSAAETPPATNGAEGAEASTSDGYERPARSNRRDPFTFIPPEPELKAKDEVRVKEPLESYDVGQLKLVAIITGTAVPTAMFVDPTGFGHFAKEDDRIGRSGGRITDIRSNEVEITINPEGDNGAANDLEGTQQGGEERPATEPVTLVIRLSDTEIRSEDELKEAEGASVLEKIQEKPEGEAASPEPTSPQEP